MDILSCTNNIILETEEYHEEIALYRGAVNIGRLGVGAARLGIKSAKLGAKFAKGTSKFAGKGVALAKNTKLLKGLSNAKSVKTKAKYLQNRGRVFKNKLARSKIGKKLKMGIVNKKTMNIKNAKRAEAIKKLTGKVSGALNKSKLYKAAKADAVKGVTGLSKLKNKALNSNLAKAGRDDIKALIGKATPGVKKLSDKAISAAKATPKRLAKIEHRLKARNRLNKSADIRKARGRAERLSY